MNKMEIKYLDLHSHILPGIDDGSKSMEESINILKDAANNNISGIVLTPHYIKESRYDCNNDKKEQILKELKKEIKKEKLKIKLYLGNEVFINDDIKKLIDNGDISTINNTKYILIEFSLKNEYMNAKYIIFDLLNNGYIPILAHPERYTYIQDDYEKLNDYLDMGVLLQGDYQSLFGKYGKKSKKILKKLLKEDKITFFGSDIHHDTNKFNIKKFYKKLKRIVKDDDKCYDLMYNNAYRVVKGKNVR